MFALGPSYLLDVPSKNIVRNDAAATAARITFHEMLFRLGLLAETLGAMVFIGLALALYRLFENADRHRARQMVAKNNKLARLKSPRRRFSTRSSPCIMKEPGT
jgi:hypothetical protein